MSLAGAATQGAHGRAAAGPGRGSCTGQECGGSPKGLDKFTAQPWGSPGCLGLPHGGGSLLPTHGVLGWGTGGVCPGVGYGGGLPRARLQGGVCPRVLYRVCLPWDGVRGGSVPGWGMGMPAWGGVWGGLCPGLGVPVALTPLPALQPAPLLLHYSIKDKRR